MCFTFKKNNKQTKKPVNCFLQDDAGAGIQSLQTSIEIKLSQNPWNGPYAASFGAKNVQETTFEAVEVILGRWNQQLYFGE